MAEFNGRQASETPSTSSSDLYTAHTTDTKDMPSTATNNPAMLPASVKTQPTPVYDDAGDASDDMDMDMSDSSSLAASSDTDVQGPAHAGAKRKLSDADMENGASAATAAQDLTSSTKRSSCRFPAR